ncbi:hypothetical protein F2P81_015238 [Scophthalmus maximus]|uniref:Uncharacterized protein n=1 Tax=Scophthalmus maximus TaxID=52904 RepID=A0A6A4SL94_SCOMX|nr:hypothetical protein F2P81_015238 [Scophthalmus maximus]
MKCLLTSVYRRVRCLVCITFCTTPLHRAAGDITVCDTGDYEDGDTPQLEPLRTPAHQTPVSLTSRHTKFADYFASGS